jgi:DNA-binding transcriptional LysR family regulator
MFEASTDDQELWRRLDWNDVRTFLAVAECGSLNAAARLLGMTQPTISRRMEDFEYRLRAKLFDRSSRGVVLTEAGLMVRDLAQSMARLGGSILRDVAGHDHSDSGRVRMSAPDGIAGFLLAPLVPKFQMANPQVHLSIDCGLGIGSVLGSEPDLTLEVSENFVPDLVSTPIATMHYCVFASREYLDLYGTPKTLTEVAEHRTVRHTSHGEQRSTLNPKAEAIAILAGSHFVSNSSAATFQAIRSGAGIGSLPTYVLTIAPELVMLDLEPWAHPVLFLRHRAMIEQQRRVKAVKDWLMEVFDPTDQPWFREEFVHPADFQRYLPETPQTIRPPRRGVRHAAG